MDNDDGGIDPVETEEIIDVPAQQNFLGENLVDLPETVGFVIFILKQLSK